VRSIEQVADKLSPLGFTPLLSGVTGEVLKYDFRGVGPRVVDKSLNFNAGTLSPDWPENAPRRRFVFPLDAVLVFDGEDDFIHVPDRPIQRLDASFSIEVAYTHRADPDDHAGLVYKGARGNQPGYALGIRKDSNRLFFKGNRPDGSRSFSMRGGDLPYNEEVIIRAIADFGEERAYITVDDNEVASDTYMDEIGAFENRLFVGRYFGFISGILKHVKIWNRVSA